MSVNYFDTKIAKSVGVNAAVIYQNLYYWCEKNKANNRSIRDGKVWTYNSVKAFSELFDYLSEKQIKTALSKLESAGLIESGCFNSIGYDRTKWYTCIELNGQTHLAKRENGTDQEAQPIPDNKQNVNPDDNTDNSINPDFSKLNATPDQIKEIKRIRKKNSKTKTQAEITQRIANNICDEFAKAIANGWTIDKCLDEWELRGWLAFKFEWLQNKRPQPPKKGIFDLSQQNYVSGDL